MPEAPMQDVTVALAHGEHVELGPLRAHESDTLFALFDAVVAAGDGYPHQPPLTPTQFVDTWQRPGTTVVAARWPGGPAPTDPVPGAAPVGGALVGGTLVGAYYLKANFVGRAAHIANGGYLVAPALRRRGIGRALVADSIWRAPLLGFDAVQFNLVFASNPARALYEDLGWTEIGRVPEAVDGEDAVIYWRRVGGATP